MPRKNGNNGEARTPVGKQSVLLVSNEHEVGGIWAYALRQQGLVVTLTASAAGALAHWAEGPRDLVLIDICGPELQGVELARRLRAETGNPILLFTPRRDEGHLLDGYRAGADECVVKPVSPSLFLAKVRVWLRRSWSAPTRSLADLERGGLRLDAARQELSNGGPAPVALTNLEFRVLHLLMSHPGQVLPADLIVERVWGLDGDGDAVLLKNVIYRLRRKIEPEPSQPCYVQTAGRQGYFFAPAL